MAKDQTRNIIIVLIILVGAVVVIKPESFNFLGSLIGYEKTIPFQQLSCSGTYLREDECNYKAVATGNPVIIEIENIEGLFISDKYAYGINITFDYLSIGGGQIKLYGLNDNGNYDLLFENPIGGTQTESDEQLILGDEYISDDGLTTRLKLVLSTEDNGAGARAIIGGLKAAFDVCPNNYVYYNEQCVQIECNANEDCQSKCVGYDYNFNGICQRFTPLNTAGQCSYSIQEDSSLCVSDSNNETNGGDTTNGDEIIDCAHAGLTSYCRQVFGEDYKCINYHCIKQESDSAEADSSSQEEESDSEDKGGFESNKILLIGGAIFVFFLIFIVIAKKN